VHAPRAASRAPQGGGARGDYNALAALPLPKRSEWRCIGNDTAIGLIQPFGAPSVRRLEIRSSNVPPAVAELALAAAAEGGRVPIVLGPPAGGEAQAGGLTAAFQGDGRLVVNSAPLIRLARAAATKLGAPVAVVLRAEPEQRRCRVWLAAPGSTGAALEAGELPEGVVQLSEGAKESDSVAAAAAPVPRPPEARTLVLAPKPLPGPLAGQQGAFFQPERLIGDGTYVCSLPCALESSNRLRIKRRLVPTAFEGALAAAGLLNRRGCPCTPVFLGPPGDVGRRLYVLSARLEDFSQRLQITSLPLIRLLRASAATAGGAPLDLAFRADPDRGVCFLWLAPAGATGAALEAPALPTGVAQLSEAALAAAAAAAARS